MSNVVFDEILGKVRAGDVNSGGGGGGGSDLIAGNGLTIAGGTASVAPGYRMNTSGGTVNQDRFFPIETVSGTSVMLQAGHAYIINATTGASITLNCESFAANTFGLEGHATIYTANAGYVQQGANVYLADPLEPDSVNNCTIRFHGGSATVSVEDYFGGYIVLSGGTGSGSLPYGLASAGSQYIGFNASLNGQTLDLAGAVTNGEKHVVGNGYSDTILTGAVNCGASSFTVANLSLQNVVVNGGVMTLGDAYIPSGSTVAVSGGGLAIEKVTGAGSDSVIDLGGKVLKGVLSSYLSGVVVTGGNGSAGGAFQIAVTDTVILSSCTVTGNATGAGGGAMRTYGTVEIKGCSVYGNIGTFGSAIQVMGGTITVASSYIDDITMNGGTVIVNGGTCRFDAISPRSTSQGGVVQIESGATLDLTDNDNPTPINPGGGIKFAEGGATVLTGATAGVVDARYSMDNVTLPAGAKLTNTAVVDLGGTHVTVSSGSTASASGCTFTDGSASIYGGNFFIAGGSAEFTSCTVQGGIATYGGGFYVNSDLKLSSCIVSGNSGANGKDIYVTGSGTNLYVDGCTVDVIRNDGGTVYLKGACTVGQIYWGVAVGSVVISSGAILDLTDNANETPIAPGGGITFEPGSATVYPSAGSSAAVNVNIAGGTFGCATIRNGGVLVMPSAGFPITDGATLGGNATIDVPNQSVIPTATFSGVTFTGSGHIVGNAGATVTFSACPVSVPLRNRTAGKYANYVFAGNCTIDSVSNDSGFTSGTVTISGGASINLTSSIAPGGGIEVLGGITVNTHPVSSGTYTTINADGSTVPPQE